MEKSKPLRIALFALEVLRLGALLLVVRFSMKGPVDFPAAVYGAADGLFFLISVFCLLDFGRYGLFIALYTAGKVFVCAAALSWFAFYYSGFLSGLALGDTGALIAAGGWGALFLGDLFSLVLAVLLLWQARKAAPCK